MACNCNDNTNCYHLNFGCVQPIVANANNYYTKSEIDTKLEDIVQSGCCITPQEVDEKIESAITSLDLSDYAKKEDIPSLSGYATEQWVTNQHYITSVDLSDYVTDAELSSYTYNKQEIDDKLDDMATMTWVLNKNYVTNSELIQYITNLQNQITSLEATISGCCGGGGSAETIYRWVTMTGDNDYECLGTTKYTKEKKQQSTDNGVTWSDVVPTQTRAGSTVLEINSTDCGYAPNYKFRGVLLNNNTKEVVCNSSSTLSSGETYTNNAYKSIEIGSCVETIGEVALRSQTFITGNLVLPSSIKTIEKDAFTNCSRLTGITLNEGLETLGEGVFKSCTALTSINIPNSVKTIGEQAFYLDRPTTVTIGSGITSIGLGAFETTTEYAQNIEYVKILATTPPTLDDASGSFTFNGSYPIYVPAASVNAYKSAWSGYADRIFPIA